MVIITLIQFSALIHIYHINMALKCVQYLTSNSNHISFIVQYIIIITTSILY